MGQSLKESGRNYRMSGALSTIRLKTGDRRFVAYFKKTSSHGWKVQYMFRTFALKLEAEAQEMKTLGC